jgi:hypothetical protein
MWGGFNPLAYIYLNVQRSTIVHFFGDRYIPQGWWHVVRNEDFTVAITHNIGYSHTKHDVHTLFIKFLEFDQRSAEVWWQWLESKQLMSEDAENLGGEVKQE